MQLHMVMAQVVITVQLSLDDGLRCLADYESFRNAFDLERIEWKPFAVH
jgi:hypothetical protein